MDHFKEWKQAATDAAASLVDGLVSGLRNGIVAVSDAAKSMGAAAITALKTTLGIHSPSKVFEQAGMFSGMGFERGLNRSMRGIDVSMPGGSVQGRGQPGAIQLELLAAQCGEEAGLHRPLNDVTGGVITGIPEDTDLAQALSDRQTTDILV